VVSLKKLTKMSARLDNLLERIDNHPESEKLNVICDVLTELGSILEENLGDEILKARVLAVEKLLLAESAKIIAEILNQGKFSKINV
jgi:ferritin-like metal-binding protein YciE